MIFPSPSEALGEGSYSPHSIQRPAKAESAIRLIIAVGISAHEMNRTRANRAIHLVRQPRVAM
jgi:hypothetical protein